VDIDPMADRPGAADDRTPSRLGPILVGALIGVLATAVIVLAVVLMRDGDGDETTTTTTSSTTTSTTSTTVPDDLRGVALRLDVLLERSARARTDVVETVATLSADCSLDPGEASQTLYLVEQSRQELITELSALQVTGNEEADELVALLIAAMQHSQHANQHFLAWVNSEYGRFYYDNSEWDEASQTMVVTCPGPAPKTEDWDEAVAASAEATAAKQEFVEAYTPVAERYDLRVWTDGEI
jgi:hypothetical protein